MPQRALTIVWMCAVLLAACGDDSGNGDDGDGGGRDSGPPKARFAVELGTPSPSGDLGFVPLEDGGDISLNTFGQGGTHAELAVRAIGFGNRAFIDVTLENLDSGATVATLPSSRPQLLICREKPQGACDMLPIYVMTGGLAEPSQKDGLRIRVIADVHGEDGDEATASREGVLRKVF